MKTTKLTVITIALILLGGVGNAHAMSAGPHYTIQNNADKKMRIEGINTRCAEDLYFSDLTEPRETIGFQGGWNYPHLALSAKYPQGSEVLAKTDDLPNYNAHITLNKQSDTYSFEITKK